MSRFRMLLFAVIGILVSSMTVFAQDGRRKPATTQAQSANIAHWRRASVSRSPCLVVRSDSRALVRRLAKARRVIRARPDVFRR